MEELSIFSRGLDVLYLYVVDRQAVELSFKKKILTPCGVNGLCSKILLMCFLTFLRSALIMALLRMASSMI